MNKVKVKFIGLFVETESALLVKLPSFEEIWIPKSLFTTKVKGNFLLVEKWFCEKCNIPYSEYINKPKKIEVINNQEALDELKL
jgi:hypothetical protein